MFSAEVNKLREKLQAHASPSTKAWWENYVKESAPFMGVKMAVVRKELHRWVDEEVEGRLDMAQQIDLALTLFEGEYTEEKLAGTLFLQEILIPAGVIECRSHVDRFASLFSKGLIYDWNVCDWFCVKVLGPLIEENGWRCAERIAAWRSARNAWQARASLVAFVNVANHRDYYPVIAESCRVVVRRPERFAKTSVGWMLREISKHDQGFVKQVIAENRDYFSSESLKNATKHLS